MHPPHTHTESTRSPAARSPPASCLRSAHTECCGNVNGGGEKRKWGQVGLAEVTAREFDCCRAVSNVHKSFRSWPHSPTPQRPRALLCPLLFLWPMSLLPDAAAGAAFAMLQGMRSFPSLLVASPNIHTLSLGFMLQTVAVASAAAVLFVVVCELPFCETTRNFWAKNLHNSMWRKPSEREKEVGRRRKEKTDDTTEHITFNDNQC